MGAGGGAEAENQQQQTDAARQEKLLSLMSLMEQRKETEAYRQQSLQDRETQNTIMDQQRQQAQQDRESQNRVIDSMKQSQLDEKTSRDQFMEGLGAQRNQISQGNLELRAMIAGRNGSATARFDAGVNTLSMLTGKSPGEVGMAMTHAGLSANGATYVATRAAEMMRAGKKPDLDQLINEGSKTKDQYGTILDNVSSAMADPKADGAKMLGPGAYSNYLIAKAKLGTLPPAERKAAEDKIKKFAAASVQPTDPDKAKGWKEPTYDDLAGLLDPSAPDMGDDGGKPAATPTSAATAPAKPAPGTPTSGATGTSKSGKPIVMGPDGKWHYAP